jgi:NADH-quinone oxidoreductase subunit L
MWIGSLALAGFPPFAGYFSKDIVLEAAYAAHSAVGNYAFWMGIAAAFMTAFYSGRLLFMTFHGEPRASHEVMHHVHESPKVMWVPLLLLAAGAVLAGWAFYGFFVGDSYEDFWGTALYTGEHNILHDAHHVAAWVKFLPLVVGIAGLALSWLFYIRRPDLPASLARTNDALYQFLLNKWYFDELYDFIFVRPAKWLGFQLWKKGDGRVIDGFGPDGVSAAIAYVARKARTLQTGYVYHYAFVMLIGVAGFITWYMFRTGGGH